MAGGGPALHFRPASLFVLSDGQVVGEVYKIGDAPRTIFSADLQIPSGESTGRRSIVADYATHEQTRVERNNGRQAQRLKLFCKNKPLSDQILVKSLFLLEHAQVEIQNFRPHKTNTKLKRGLNRTFATAPTHRRYLTIRCRWLDNPEARPTNTVR